MDINALLSSAPPTNKSPRKQQRPSRPSAGKRTASSLSVEVKQDSEPPEWQPSSQPPSSRGGSDTASLPHGTQPGFPLHVSPESTSASHQAHYYPTSHPTTPLGPGYDGHASRPLMNHRNSTPQMETLADLASMQQRPQPARSLSGGSLRQGEIEAVQRSPSMHQLGNLPPPPMRNHSGQSLADLTMAEGPAQTPPPRRFSSSALSESESSTVTDLLRQLTDNSYSYDVNVSLINLLHKGFVAHVKAAADTEDGSSADLHSYALLTELRQAREAMDSRFAVGEDLWVDWLADETLLANSSESRIGLTELFQKAVQDIPASVNVWRAYYSWVMSNYSTCHDLPDSDQTGWSEEDKEMCKELFTRDLLFTVAEQGAVATQWRLDESHLVWSKFAQLVLENIPAAPAISDIENVRDIFVRKLQLPHAGWSETAQMFWPVVNKYEPDNWEVAMAQVNELAEPAKKEMTMREEHEHKLSRTLESGHRDAIFAEFTSYLRWEQTRRHKQQGPHAFEIRCGLYERALLRFPTYTEWWIDYIDFVISRGPHTSALSLIERATRHCPWSGDLWARRILRSDVEGKSHEEIESTKHRATNSGLLDVGGMEELLKVQQQWCSYLRRQAFRKEASEDDIDTAEVGIMMALEDIEQAGKRIYGEDFPGDPLYRLEMIQIKFYSQSRRLNDARDIYKRLAQVHKDSYDFWAKYYAWELMLWGFERISETHRVETAENGPHIATAVLQEALGQRNLDYPERVLEVYLNHFQQHESGERLEAALIDAREFSKHLAIRRAKEATEAAEVAAQEQASMAAAAETANPEPVAVTGREKRKAEDSLPNGDAYKKNKTEGAVATKDEPEFSGPAQAKRDREHNTITVRNLPNGVREAEITKFFREIGRPKSINILQDASTNTATATVEFESQEDVLAAKTRSGKQIDGYEVSINSGGQSTLYVANYPAEYDEAAMRGLFDSYGEIVSVRFPSLKFNNRRRFCYVSYVNENMAKAAEQALDGKMLDGQHRLLAKISNPDAKKQRSGAQAEGREIIAKNLPWSTSEDKVKEFFAEYGQVSSVKLLKLVNGRLTGTGFVVFESVEEATAATAANNKPFDDRILHVEISTAKGGVNAPDKSRKTDVIVKHTSPDAERRGSDASMNGGDAADEAAKTARVRKVAILDLPETVNDARIRAAMEQYGPITKIQLRRQDRGAIVEFSSVQDAFNVRQGVDCSSLGPNVRTGDVPELLNKVKQRQEASAQGGGTTSTSGGAGKASSGFGMRPATVARPGQQRGGRRGGLGSKRGGLGFGSTGKKEGDGDQVMGDANGTSSGATRSNDDFRQMLAKSREVAEKKEEEKTAE